MKNNGYFASMNSQNVELKKKIYKSLKAKSDAQRTMGEKIADFMTTVFGTMTFFTINFLLFLFWILANTGKLSFVGIFDPYPFNLLTNIVSLEAIFLAIFVLISQNRALRLDDLRQETDLQVNLITEREITKVMSMMVMLLEKQGINVSNDKELQKMLEPTNEEEIEKSLESEIF